MKMEQLTLNKERNVTLTCYLQDVSGEFPNIVKRPAVLVLPGGGYQICSDREADPIALSYAQAGFQAFILRYSLKEKAVWPNPLEDYEQAMELIRGNAELWKLYADKVAVIGFSAGGHLAAAAATMARNKPNAAILGYAVTEEAIAKACLPTAPDLVSKVDPHTCPCFLFATRTDNVVPISNTIHFTDALDRNGIMFESHIYAYGPHGFSTGDSSVLTPDICLNSRASRWVSDSVSWLRELFGDFGDGALTVPTCPARVNDNHEPFCSVRCTVGHLMANAQARALLLPMLQAAAQAHGGSVEDSLGMAANMTLLDALNYGKTPKNVIEQLDSQLRKIPNA